MGDEVQAGPARITLTLSEEGGSFDLYLNDAGREALIQALQALSKESDHIHLAPPDMGEIAMRPVAYADGQRVIQWGKILYRPDDWDREYYPHVMES